MEPKDVLSVYSSIGQTNLDSIPRQLVVVGGADDDVPLEPGIGDLEADIHFWATDDHPVLGGVPFVLDLDNETFAGKLVSLNQSHPPPPELIWLCVNPSKGFLKILVATFPYFILELDQSGFQCFFSSLDQAHGQLSVYGFPYNVRKSVKL